METWDNKTYFNFEVFKLIIKAIALILLVKYFAPKHQEANNKSDIIKKTVIINDTIHQTIEKIDTVDMARPRFSSVFVGRSANNTRVITEIKGPCVPDTVTSTVNDTITIIQEAPPKPTTNDKRLRVYAAATGGAPLFAPGVLMTYKNITAGAFYTPTSNGAPVLFTIGYKLKFGKSK